MLHSPNPFNVIESDRELFEAERQVLEETNDELERSCRDLDEKWHRTEQLLMEAEIANREYMNRVDELESQMDKMKCEFNELNDNLIAAHSEIKFQKTKQEKYEVELAQLRSEKEMYLKREDEYNEAIDTLGQHVSEMQVLQKKEVEEYKDHLHQKYSNFSQREAEYEAEQQRNKEEIEQLKKELDMEKKKQEMNNMNWQYSLDEMKKEMMKRLQAYQPELELSNKKYKDLESSLKMLKETLKEKEEEWSEKEKTYLEQLVMLEQLGQFLIDFTQ